MTQEPFVHKACKWALKGGEGGGEGKALTSWLPGIVREVTAVLIIHLPYILLMQPSSEVGLR